VALSLLTAAESITTIVLSWIVSISSSSSASFSVADHMDIFLN